MKISRAMEDNSDNSGLRQSRIDWFFSNSRGCVAFETPVRKGRKRLTKSVKKSIMNTTIESRILPYPLSSSEEEEDGNSNSSSEFFLPSVCVLQDKPITPICLNKPTKQSLSQAVPSTSKDLSQPVANTSHESDDEASSEFPFSQASVESVIVPVVKSNRKITDSDSESEQANEQNISTVPPKKQRLKVEPIKNADKSFKKEDSKMNLRILNVFNAFFPKALQTHLCHLLREEEKELLMKYVEAQQKYQYLCLKLFTWKPMWYNIFKFGQQIGLKMTDQEIMKMFNFIKDNKFVDTDYLQEDTAKLLNFLEYKELKEIAQTFKIKLTSRKKGEVIEKLLKNCETQSTLTQLKSSQEVLKGKIKEKMGFCIKLAEPMQNCLFKVFLLGTFASDFLLPQDFFKSLLFNRLYPSFPVENYRVFRSEDEFARFTAAAICHNDFNKAIERKNPEEILQIAEKAMEQLKIIGGKCQADRRRAPHLERYLPATKYVNVLSSASKLLTPHFHAKVKDWLEQLISLDYCKHKRGFWYNQLALVQSKYLKDHELAVKTVIKALSGEKASFSQVQLHELSNRGRSLMKKSYNISALYHDELASHLPDPLNCSFRSVTVDCKTMRANESGRKRNYVEHCNDGSTAYLTVEQVAIQHYNTKGYKNGIHCEGRLICTIFTLLFWDIIYEFPVPGTFVSELQCYPLDMYTQYFYGNREFVIDQRLEQIRSDWSEEELREMIIENFQSHLHEECLYKLDVCFKEAERYLETVACITRGILAKILEKLVQNYKDYSAGLPDLFLWNLEDGTCKFVEVKGENDKLSVKQKLWLTYLDSIGADVEVCHVHSTGSKKKEHKK